MSNSGSQKPEPPIMNLSLLSVSRPPPEKPTCSECGSDDVRADAFAAWNAESQCWEVASTHDKGGCCEGCGKGDVRFVWVPA
jgi:hypothetical protein